MRYEFNVLCSFFNPVWLSLNASDGNSGPVGIDRAGAVAKDSHIAYRVFGVTLKEAWHLRKKLPTSTTFFSCVLGSVRNSNTRHFMSLD